MRAPAILGGMIVALALPVAAQAADDYPYSGFFTSQTVDVAPDDAQLACAYSFFKQNLDGSFVGYLIDKQGYAGTGAVRYVQYGRGTCTITGGRVETCTMTASPDAAEVGQSYFDVLRSIQPEAIENASFDNAQDANVFALSGIGQPSVELRFSVCHGFDDAHFHALLADELTTLPVDERSALQSPTFDDASRAKMTAILRKIGTRQ